jgi:hypothetical protein
MGGASAVSVERIFGKDTPIFDAHILTNPNMGVDVVL